MARMLLFRHPWEENLPFDEKKNEHFDHFYVLIFKVVIFKQIPTIIKINEWKLINYLKFDTSLPKILLKIDEIAIFMMSIFKHQIKT